MTACATLASYVPQADACGCTSPPVPSVDESNYAVNQQSEQIIFEVEPGFVTAHVLIRYVGDPSQFAWLVPVPSAPELDLSESILFGLLDQASAPVVNLGAENLCPWPEYECTYHPPPTDCYEPGTSASSGSAGPSGAGGFNQGAGGGGGAGAGGDTGGVDVKQKQQIGSYETVTFAAGDAQAAVDWLQANGFIVNSTMTPFMQPYLDANMLFVAAKLIPGAGAEEIKPLKMRYQAAAPMIPLQLTAVAAEPNLTVTSYIFGSELFAPDGHPLVTLDPMEIASDRTGRVNYPMLMARAIDDAGRDGFVNEYSGVVPQASFQIEGCCQDSGDSCFIGNDDVCQCPNQEFDAQDCAEEDGLLAAVGQLETLQSTHGYMTRLTTRLSPEEMTFDPGFVGVGTTSNRVGRLVLDGVQKSLVTCEDDIIDKGAYDDIVDRTDCSATYCGAGECVHTTQGAACLCEAGYVARTFNDLDGLPSVTCVPATNTVDFTNNSELVLPNACDNVSCGTGGTCVDVGGFPTCDCAAGHAAVLDENAVTPVCHPVQQATGTRGARDYSDALEVIAVCAPAPPSCGDFGWLVPASYKPIEGVLCESSYPSPEQLAVPPEPTCMDVGLLPPEFGAGSGDGDDGASGGACGCGVVGDSSGDDLALLLMLGLGFGLVRRRRRR